MNANNIPKKKKHIDPSALKKAQSLQIFTKTTKRKSNKKSLLSTAASRSTLLQSVSPNAKISKPVKKVKTKSSQNSLKKVLSDKDCKAGRENSIKTAKKVPKKKKEIELKEQQLTQRKKNHHEYFMYKDTYLPIENTQQRKLVFKIKLIDEKSTTLKQKQPEKAKVYKMIEAATQMKMLTFVDKATQPSDRKQYKSDIECQTEQEKNQLVRLSQQSQSSASQEEQEPEKCFVETLSQLEFLYLPDEKNFEGFSKNQKTHYKQLLLCLAKKFEEQNIPILDDQTVEALLCERQMKQRGLIQSFPKKGLPTHTPSVVSYIANLFCYIQIHEKSNLIDRINCSYGYSLFDKLNRLRSGKTTKRHINLIPDSTFWKFEVELHQGLHFEQQFIQEALHSHNKAIFDATNQALLQFQPYFSCRGEPFPWSENLQTTFYCITDDSYGALVGQVKDKIWESANILAGILVDEQPQQKHKLHVQKIFANQQKLILNQSKQYSEKVDKDECRTKILCEIADSLQMQIIDQIVAFLLC